MKLLVLLSVVAILSVQGQYNCSTQTPAFNRECFTNSLFLFDFSSTISNNDANMLINYALNDIAPRLAYSHGQNVGFAVYGSGNTLKKTSITSFYPILCQEISNTLFSMPQLTNRNLSSVMDEIATLYADYLDDPFNIVLYSASWNRTEISEAGQIARKRMANARFSVVALTGKADIWSDFPASLIIPAKPWELRDGTDTKECLLDVTCGYYNSEFCALRPSPTIPVQTAPVDEYDCKCDEAKYGADIILYFDSSLYTGALRTRMLLEMAKKTLLGFNIVSDLEGTSGNNTARIAILTNCNNVPLFPLGKLSKEKFFELENLPISSYCSPNYAVDASYNVLSSKRRLGVQPIMLYFTSYNMPYYKYDTTDDKVRRAVNNITLLTPNGGSVMTYQLYFPEDLPTDGHINQFVKGTPRCGPSSGNYYFPLSYENPNRLKEAICNSNCYCPSGFTANATNSYCSVTGGCLLPSFNLAASQGSYLQATQQCAKVNGIVAPAKTLADTNRISSLVGGTSSYFWIGMEWIDGKGYTWSDGTPANGPYQPWYNNMTHPIGSDCVFDLYSSNTHQWVPISCKNANKYVCKAHPCNSINIC